MIGDIAGRSEEAVKQPIVAEVPPDILNRVQLGRLGRQRERLSLSARSTSVTCANRPCIIASDVHCVGRAPVPGLPISSLQGSGPDGELAATI